MQIKGIEGSALAKAAAGSPYYKNVHEFASNQAYSAIYRQLGPMLDVDGGKNIPQGLINYATSMGFQGNANPEVLKTREFLKKSAIRPMNELAKRLRDVRRGAEDPNWLDLTEYGEFGKALSKATLDVGSFTNFANVTGGQALGYISLDTRMARQTVRPSSFTLYQALDKSLAWQIVDFWALVKSTGGAAPGSAFGGGFTNAAASAFPSVATGSLTTSAGTYDMLNIVLKLALDGRAITMALAAQNNYVNISEQETANAALVVLQSMNWACYHGDSSLFANQFDGIGRQLVNGGYTQNIFDYYQFSNNFSTAHSWSPELTLYNMIYECAAQITGYANFGHITHAFMSPADMGALQGITNTTLNNIVNQLTEIQGRDPIFINGDLIGMRTRFGQIQFPMDLFIDARNIPLQAIVVDGVSQVTSTINKPTSVTAAIVTGSNATGSNFNGSYTPNPGGGDYVWAVAACDSSMNESQLTYTSLTSGVPVNGGVQLTITPNGANQVAFRIFRSGLGGCVNNSSPQPNEFRYVGAVAASGASSVTWTDLNGGFDSTGTVNGGAYTTIPGSSSIFLLDMDPMDYAIDFRMLLPLVRVELFAANLYMPWAVTEIGALRLRTPKFHGIIRNYVPTNPTFNPLSIN